MARDLSTELFYGMILAGAKQVIHNESELNRLNVYPVADRDTGTNLASMMRYIVENLSKTRDMQDLLTQLSQHGLMSSSGNSGLIFSQFFYGLTQHKLSEKTKLRLGEFAEIITLGYKSAYKAVSNPKVGTVLTVMEKWVEAYREDLKNTKINLIDIFRSSIDKAKVALKDTMNQLEVLRANHVVDAGAQGFVNFLEGMLLFLTGSKEQRQQILNSRENLDSVVKIDYAFESVNELPNHRYCFETVVRAENEHLLDSYHDQLEALGDSMVIGKGQQLIKLHIHTDEPTKVTDLLTKLGSIAYQKIDDMILQYDIANQLDRPKIALIADTMADIPVEFLNKYKIYRIPLQVKVNDNSFLDKFSINYQQTLAYLAESNNKVGTAAPSAAIIARTIHFIGQFYDSIIILSVSKSLSSTYDIIANQAAKFTEKPITVIDSGLGSAPLGLLLAYANSLIQQKLPHQEVVEKIELAKQDANALILLNSLDGLTRSGRISKSMGFIARMLGFLPIIQIDEKTRKPKVISAAFTKKSGWVKITKILNKLNSQNKIKTIAVVHSGSLINADKFSQFIIKQTGLYPVYISEVSSVSGIHTDKNSFSIGYINEHIEL